jgi:uncharacterized protein with NRDE domain
MDRRETVYDGDDVVEVIYHDKTWGNIRSARNQALKDSDWRAGKDVVLSTAWKEYRQALRDLPQNHVESNDAADAWPSPPE